MSFKPLCGYETVKDAHLCAERLHAEGVECVLRHRGKGLFGDAATDDLTWIDVPEAEFDRANQLLFPEIEDPDVKLELQCPRCRSLRVKFDIVSHKTGLGKIFTWPWDKERFFCEDCRHVWDREPEAQPGAAPNRGPATPLGNSGVTEGPPSASSFICHTCGQVHDELPLSFGADAPVHYYDVPEHEREQRTLLGSDQCVIDDEHYFVRGCLDIPIRDSAEVFRWGVWVSLSEESFHRMSELWETPGRESEPPFFGWLCTPLPGYPDTTKLKTLVHTRPMGERPFIELEPGEHPLAVEQRCGISLARAREIGESLLHGPSAS